MKNQINSANKNQNQIVQKATHLTPGIENVQKKPGMTALGKNDGERTESQHKGKTITTPTAMRQTQKSQGKTNSASGLK